jgi:hypothetical protein
VSRAGPHNRLVIAEANAGLKPLGLGQRGRSRSWLDDHGDSVIVVEFQSHNYKPGTFLNVGVCWLWSPKAYLTFDFGHRIGDFAEYIDEESFVAMVRMKVGEAIDAVRRYRSLLASRVETAAALAGLPLLERSSNKLYNVAIASAMADRWQQARELAAKIGACAYGPPKFRDPVLALHKLAHSLLTDDATFRAQLAGIVAQSRAALRLPPVTEIPPAR